MSNNDYKQINELYLILVLLLSAALILIALYVLSLHVEIYVLEMKLIDKELELLNVK